MIERPRKGGPRGGRAARVAFAVVASVVPTLVLAVAPDLGGGRVAHAGDLSTDGTTKAGGDSTAKDLSTGGTSLTKSTGTKPTAPKPTTTTVPTASSEPEASTSASAEPEPEPPPVPSASASASAANAGPLVRRKVDLGVGDLAVAFRIPESWPELGDAALPAVEETPEAKVVARKGFGVHDPKGKPPVVREVVVVCGKASGEYWADAIRDAAFTQMTAAVEKEAGHYTTLASIEPEPVRADGDRFLQPFAAEAEFAIDGKAMPVALGKGKPKAATTVKLQGLSFIGFHAEEKGGTPDIVACSVACAQLVESGETSVCAEAIGSIEISGSFSPAPKRSAIAELVFKLKKDPTTFWLVVIGAAFVLVAVPLLLLVAVRRRKAAAADAAEPDEADDGFEAGYHAGLAAANAAAEIRSTMHASAPPPEGYFDPQTLTRRKV